MTIVKWTMALAMFPGAGLAGLEICNDTEARQTVAIGYKGDADWVSEGWWNIQPGNCVTPVKGDLKRRYYYLLTKSSGWIFDDENIVFCTASDAFTIVGDTDCKARGYRKGQFAKIDTGKTAKDFSLSLSAFTRLVPPPEMSKEPDTGAYGEPYADAATFQGCNYDIDPGYCSFYVGATEFFAYDDGRSNPYAFKLMMDFNPGTPIAVEGELVGVFDATAEVVLSEVDTRAWTGADELLDRMQGYWYETSDSSDQFNILGSERIGYYDGNYSGTEALSVQEWCGDFEGDGPYLLAREPETGEQYCYQISYVGDLEMSLMYLPGGRFLDYRRLD